MIRTIDEVDKRILALLIEDAGLTNKEIAGILNVSPATIHLRIRKMHQKGVIKGSSIAIDYDVVGYTLTCYIAIIIGRTKDSHEIMKKISVIPEVTMANITTGQFGAFCKVRCKNTEHLKEIIFKMNSIDGVQRTESMISLEETVNDKSRLFNHAFGLNN
ncbi:MAG: winged helix-turn-helix transcriptional regulator [Flavobacteriales bacterium]|nr:winged helix-turn-helix transcriptional regulator [Flavobacteriales bacterium]